MASVGGTKVIQHFFYCLSPLSLAKTERLFNQPEEIFSKILKLLVGSYFFVLTWSLRLWTSKTRCRERHSSWRPSTTTWRLFRSSSEGVESPTWTLNILSPCLFQGRKAVHRRSSEDHSYADGSSKWQHRRSNVPIQVIWDLLCFPFIALSSILLLQNQNISWKLPQELLLQSFEDAEAHEGLLWMFAFAEDFLFLLSRTMIKEMWFTVPFTQRIKQSWGFL